MAAFAPIGAAVFALNPGEAVPGILNMTTKEGQKFYKDATRPLFREEELFDLSSENLNILIKLLKERAEQYNWIGPGGIAMVPENPAAAIGPEVNVITQYGEKTLDELRLWEQTYISTQTRVAQDTHMLYRLLMGSLSLDAKRKIMLREADYTVSVPPNAREFKSGILLFKVIVTESHIDTNATTSAIRFKISNLHEHITKIGSDIPSFNQHVKTLVEGLAARGETSSDLLVNVFKAYKVAGDKEFVKYIKMKESDHEDGNTITPNELMEMGERKFRILMEKEEWQAKTEEEKGIVALQAEVSELRAKIKERSRKGTGRGGGTPTIDGPGPKPEWLKKHTPPSNLKEKRQWGRNENSFCCAENGGHCDGKWRLHKPTDCIPMEERNKKQDAKRKRSGETEGDERKKKLGRAMESLGVPGAEDSDDSDDLSADANPGHRE